MPVVVVETKKKIPVLTVRQKTEADGPFVEDEKWGFKITGGSEFGMPITVFNVSTFSFFFTSEKFYLKFLIKSENIISRDKILILRM